MCGGCGGNGIMISDYGSNVSGNVVGTPASNPFAGGPTTLTGGTAAAAAAAPIAGTAATTTTTAKAGSTPTSTGDCGCRRPFWQDLLFAIIIGVVVAVVAKKVS